VSLLELIESVASLIGRTPQLAYLPLPQDDPSRRRPDIRRAELALGWTPQVPLREGLRRTIDWFARAGGWPTGFRSSPHPCRRPIGRRRVASSSSRAPNRSASASSCTGR